jgi:hypothetical protein
MYLRIWAAFCETGQQLPSKFSLFEIGNFRLSNELKIKNISI